MSGRNGSDLPGDVPPPPDYPTIRFLLRHGQSLGLTAGVAIALCGFAASINGMGWAWALLGLLLGPFAYLMLRSYAELIKVIAETLLPR
jgi:hypothetical protein